MSAPRLIPGLQSIPHQKCVRILSLSNWTVIFCHSIHLNFTIIWKQPNSIIF